MLFGEGKVLNLKSFGFELLLWYNFTLGTSFAGVRDSTQPQAADKHLDAYSIQNNRSTHKDSELCIITMWKETWM